MIWLLPVQPMLNALLATPLLWGQEFGWRGDLQMRPYPGRPLLAAVGTGVIWVCDTCRPTCAATTSPGDP